MTTWTKELPKEDGYYWYRTTPQTEAQVVELDLTMPWVMFTGSDVPHGPSFLHKIGGEFWPIRLTPPPEREETITVTADMWEKMGQNYASVVVPARQYVHPAVNIPVKIDPNHPHA